MMTEVEVRAALREWVISKNGKIDRADLNDQTPLLEERIISSLQVMDLILFLEKLSENSVSVEQLKVGVFQSIDMIYKTFFKEVCHEA